MSCYDFIYMLKPNHEIGPGWWSLRWEPIFGHTWRVFSHKKFQPLWKDCGLGVRWWRGDACNGWNRYFKKLNFDIQLLWFDFGGWIIWDIHVHKDGPSDISVKRPLVLQ